MSYTNSKHALQILVSKKGTKVVVASDLHNALQIPAYKFNSNIDKWLKDVYLFNDGLRKPEAFKDFAERKMMYSKGQDFYISLPLAKMICLNSESKFKASIARLLLISIPDQKGNAASSPFAKVSKGKSNPSLSPVLHQKSQAIQLGLW